MLNISTSNKNMFRSIRVRKNKFRVSVEVSCITILLRKLLSLNFFFNVLRLVCHPRCLQLNQTIKPQQFSFFLKIAQTYVLGQPFFKRSA